MTITEQTPLNTYNGNNVEVRYAFTFTIIDNADISVTLNGSSTTAFTLENVTGLGGDVVFNSAPANGAAIRIFRDTPVDQDTAYAPFDPFPAESHEAALDKLTMLVQELLAGTLPAPIPVSSFAGMRRVTSQTFSNLTTAFVNITDYDSRISASPPSMIDTVAGTITIAQTGFYIVNYTCTGRTTAGTNRGQWSLVINGSSLENLTTINQDFIANHLISGSTLLSLTAGDVLSMAASASGSVGDTELFSVNVEFSVHKIL